HQPRTTTIFPPASPASMRRCASRISSKPNTPAGLALSLPAATPCAISCSGTSDSGNPGVPNTLSSPPNFFNTIARTALLQLIGTDSGRAEVADCRRDLARMRLQREVARLEEADHCTWNVALERLGARRQEERIVLAPHREERRPPRAEVFL